jgi:Tol biopolymer transport system component
LNKARNTGRPRTTTRLSRRRLALAGLAPILLATSLATMGPAGAVAAGTVTLASHSPVGAATTPVGSSTTPAISANGAFVVFQSTATNVVPSQSDANGGTDIFLWSRATGKVTLVSHAAGAATTAGNGASTLPVISADGNYVAFASTATNLVSGQNDTNTLPDIFLYSRATGVTALVSHSGSNLTTASGASDLDGFSVSADGAFVTFIGSGIAYLYARANGGITMVSHAFTSPTSAPSGGSYHPTISANGGFVAFASSATNLVTGQSDDNFAADVFLFTRSTGAVALVSHVPASATTTGNAQALRPVISGDGAFVAFESNATNLAPGVTDVNGESQDVFLYSRDTQAVELVSHHVTNVSFTGNAFSERPRISADGAYVAFGSTASDMAGSDSNGTFDVFLYSRASRDLTLVSHSNTSIVSTAAGPSGSHEISSDGIFVTFSSLAADVISSTDTNGADDAFVFVRPTAAVILASHVPASATTTANGASGSPAISSDGSVVVFSSTATNLVSGQSDGNGAGDVFVFGRTAYTPPRPITDFDFDGDADISVFRPSNNTWFVRNGATTPFGAAGDIPVPCDYDGNGTADIAVFRPSAGAWFIKDQPTVFLGASGDVPVPADYDGNGTCDPSVFRPSIGGWYRANAATVFHGLNGDIPVPADYDGNGTADITVFRPSVGGWYRSGQATVFFGLNSDIPVRADYDGNGTADFAVFRPSVGGWYVMDQATQFLGLSGDIPVAADYDGNGAAERAVFRPSTGAWYVGASAPVFFGFSGDRPLPLPSATRQVFFP